MRALKIASLLNNANTMTTTEKLCKSTIQFLHMSRNNTANSSRVVFSRRPLDSSYIRVDSINEALINVQSVKPRVTFGIDERVELPESSETAKELAKTITERFATDHHGPNRVAEYRTFKSRQPRWLQMSRPLIIEQKITDRDLITRQQ